MRQILSGSHDNKHVLDALRLNGLNYLAHVHQVYRAWGICRIIFKGTKKKFEIMLSFE